MLELAFENRALRELCEHQAHAEARLGILAAEKLRHRLADLRAAEAVQELLATQVAQPGLDNSQFAISLDDRARLILVCNHRHTPLLANGDVAWGNVRRVKLLKIEVDND